jgi:hypothetical protein
MGFLSLSQRGFSRAFFSAQLQSWVLSAAHCTNPRGFSLLFSIPISHCRPHGSAFAGVKVECV